MLENVKKLDEGNGIILEAFKGIWITNVAYNINSREIFGVNIYPAGANILAAPEIKFMAHDIFYVGK